MIFECATRWRRDQILRHLHCPKDLFSIAGQIMKPIQPLCGLAPLIMAFLVISPRVLPRRDAGPKTGQTDTPQSCQNATVNMIVPKDGTVEVQNVGAGHPLLAQAAADAVKQWRYEPTTVNGEPVEIETKICVIFSLAIRGKGICEPIGSQEECSSGGT